jgi:hypothetical protein
MQLNAQVVNLHLNTMLVPTTLDAGIVIIRYGVPMDSRS